MTPEGIFRSQDWPTGAVVQLIEYPDGWAVRVQAGNTARALAGCCQAMRESMAEHGYAMCVEVGR